MISPKSIRPEIAAIPIIDIRDGGPVLHARERSLQVRSFRPQKVKGFASLPALRLNKLGALQQKHSLCRDNASEAEGAAGLRRRP